MGTRRTIYLELFTVQCACSRGSFFLMYQRKYGSYVKRKAISTLIKDLFLLVCVLNGCP